MYTYQDIRRERDFNQNRVASVHVNIRHKKRKKKVESILIMTHVSLAATSVTFYLTGI